MNPHVLQGTVVFVIWSIFSIWYYVTNITGEDQIVKSEKASTLEVVEATAPKAETTLVDTVLKQTEMSAAIDWRMNLYFELSTTNLINQTAFTAFLDSLQKMPAGNNYQLTIEGHTCDLGTASYNDALSKKRAEKIASLILPALNENTKSSVTGKGESSPMAPNNNEENRSKNRRVEIHLTN